MDIKITNNVSTEIEETIVVDLGAQEIVLKPTEENKTNAKALSDFIAYFNTNFFTVILDTPYWAFIDLISSVDSVENTTPIEINFNDLPAKIKKVFLEINTHSFAE